MYLEMGNIAFKTWSFHYKQQVVAAVSPTCSFASVNISVQPLQGNKSKVRDVIKSIFMYNSYYPFIHGFHFQAIIL